MMISFLFDLIGALFRFAGNALDAALTAVSKLFSALCSGLFYPLSLLTERVPGLSWWPVFCIGWAVLILLFLVLIGWVLMARRRKGR